MVFTYCNSACTVKIITQIDLIHWGVHDLPIKYGIMSGLLTVAAFPGKFTDLTVIYHLEQKLVGHLV